MTGKKIVIAAILVCAVTSQVVAQIVMTPNGTITIRSYNYSTTHTDHYGDLEIQGGNQGNNWGWLSANSAYIYGYTSISGNLNVTGRINGGIKSFIHPHPTDESKIIRYISIESGEALTLVRGTAKTENGEATVPLPEHFSMTTSPKTPVTVILTPKGASVLLYTKQDSKEQIVVAMRKSDLAAFGDVEFAFQVTGVRDGFENMDVIMNAKEFYSPSFKDGWEDTEVGTRIKAHNEKVQTWHEAEKKEKYKRISGLK